MELVPVPGSGIEMTLDHHLAFNVALECVVPSIEIEKKASETTSNNNNFIKNTSDKQKQIADAYPCNDELYGVRVVGLQPQNHHCNNQHSSLNNPATHK